MTIRGQAAPVSALRYLGRTVTAIIALGATIAVGYLGLLMTTGRVVFG